MKEIINFISSAQRLYILFALSAFVVAFFVIRKNLYDENDKVGSSLKITVTLFVISMIELSLYLIAFGEGSIKLGEGITVANVLSTIASFTAPFIAFSGAYSIFEFGQKKAEQEKKANEGKEKTEKETKENKELEHKKNMLYTMLEYSILQTRIPTREIEEFYLERYQNINTNVSLAQKYRLTGNFTKDYKIMMSVKDTNDYEAFMNTIKQYDNILEDKLNKHKVSNRTIYIENWYEYLDCVQNVEEVHEIILWINILKNPDWNVDSYINLFLANRENMDKIIRKNYPKVIDEGLRNTFKLFNMKG